MAVDGQSQLRPRAASSDGVFHSSGQGDSQAVALKAQRTYAVCFNESGPGVADAGWRTLLLLEA
jgi:hypothetical protein